MRENFVPAGDKNSIRLLPGISFEFELKTPPPPPEKLEERNKNK